MTERKRSEAALMNVIQEAFVNGVSTRKIENLAKSLGIDSISKGHVSNKAAHVVCGVKLDGTRDILAVEPMYEESETSYTALFDKLKVRGIERVWLVVSDAHKGLVSAKR